MTLPNTDVTPSPEATDAPADKAIVSSPFIPSHQSVSDMIDGDLGEGVHDSIEAEDQTPDPAQTPSASELTDEKTDDSDVDINQIKDKDGFKKGLDKVKAQRDEAIAKAKASEAKTAEVLERVTALEKKLEQSQNPPPDETTQSKTDKLSDKDLIGVIDEFIKEQNAQGLYDVLKYMNNSTKEDIVSEYRKEQAKVSEGAHKHQAEWQGIIKNYSPDSYDQDFIKNDVDFDITKPESALYKQADKIYSEGIKAKNSRYVGQGGMEYAVEQAFMGILRDKIKNVNSSKDPKNTKPAPKTNETEGLKNLLAKQQRKNALSNGAASTEDSTVTTKDITPADELRDVLSERRNQRNKRVGLSSL